MKAGVAYLAMLCCYVYYVDDSKKQNNATHSTYKPTPIRRKDMLSR